MKINIENVLKRVNDAKIKRPDGYCATTAEKALDVVSSKSDPYCQSVKDNLAAMLDEVNAILNQDKVLKPKNDENKELDELFAPKKKW